MSEPDTRCTQPAKGPIIEQENEQEQKPEVKAEVKRMTARVGQRAPDFEANAFVGGGFKTIRLSDFKGQWVILCFYPGDFTFV